MKLRYSTITHNSLVNGPGIRNVLHLQGCTIGCKGCFNTHTWSHKSGETASPYKLAWMLLKSEPEAITISGGEPTEQWDTLLLMLEECHKIRPSLDILMFTGVTEDKLRESGILEKAFSPYHSSPSLISTIVCGPYDRNNPSEAYLLGSENQKILTWNGKPLQAQGPRVEVQISGGGNAVVTGFPSKDAIKEFKKNFNTQGK